MPDKKRPFVTRRAVLSRRALLLLALALLVLIGAIIFWFWRTSGRNDFGRPWLEFSGERAFAHVEAIVALGPRPPASAAIEKTRAYIRTNLNALGWQVQDQTFSDRTPEGLVTFVNLIARHRQQSPPNEPRFLLASHYDTKTFSHIRFVGANDGGSSTGALIEMARVLSLHPQLADRIDLVFFDGEEAYEQFTETDGLYGARYFARHLSAHYRGGILWDMIGDRDLTITLSPDSPAELTRDMFASADALRLREHFTYSENNILDDHSPLNAAGIPTIDLIDFDYPPWHTAADTMDKLSAESLQTVGAVTAYYLANFAFK